MSAILLGIENPGRKGEILINEYGLYDLTLASPLPSAKQFKRWITHDVLPQIRKTGNYISNNTPVVTQNEIKEFKDDISYLRANITIKKKNSNTFVKTIKNHLGITNISEDKTGYEFIKDMFLSEMNVDKFEDITVNRDNLLKLKECCDLYKSDYEQLDMFDKTN